jgi:hypothetical protein
VDRVRPGSKHHLLTDGAGIPLLVPLTGGNRHEVTQLLPLLEWIPPVRGRLGRPQRRPDAVYADRAYHYRKYRTAVRQRPKTFQQTERGSTTFHEEHGGQRDNPDQEPASSSPTDGAGP